MTHFLVYIIRISIYTLYTNMYILNKIYKTNTCIFDAQAISDGSLVTYVISIKVVVKI